MNLLGYDIGTSSVKAALLDAESGTLLASSSSPAEEMAVSAPRPGFAEQDPETWWTHVKAATAMLRAATRFDPTSVAGIGISYQMHGLVLVDGALRVLRPAILWCDGRAVAQGERAAEALGREACFRRLLNLPGNFTLSKLLWVKENEPGVLARARHALLPGDWAAARMTGEAATTPSGLSEMILWDFEKGAPAGDVLERLGLPASILPRIAPTFGVQGKLTREAAAELGIAPGIPVSYRAGDQPNNALSLNVLEPGEIAATAGTSGVIYAVSDRPACDPRNRVNPFLHVNHGPRAPRIGVLLCVNGTGSLYRWIRRVLGEAAGADVPYERLDALSSAAPPGSSGLSILPFGNGAERILENRDPGAAVHGLSFSLHGLPHLLRASQEGVVFALRLGAEIVQDMGIPVRASRAGHANLFRSALFASTFAAATGAPVELFDTDGAQGAARGAGIGAGVFGSFAEAFRGLRRIRVVDPDPALAAPLEEAYGRWKRRAFRAID
jgi:xylulokinase